MMVKDHSTSTANLKTAAAQVSGVTVNPQMTALQQNNLDALRNAGDTFDTVYAQQQVSAHEQALSLLQDYAANGDAAPLKTFAGDTATVVEGHLTKARDLP
jgi:putative membrane protein